MLVFVIIGKKGWRERQTDNCPLFNPRLELTMYVLIYVLKKESSLLYVTYLLAGV